MLVGQNTKLKIKVKGDPTFVEVGRIQSIGDIPFKERSVIVDDCMSDDTIDKVLGTFSLGNMAISYNYDPAEPNGNGIIQTAQSSTSTVKLEAQIELSNSLGANGTQIDFDCIVPKYSVGGFAKDGRLVSNTTLELTSNPAVTPAS